jgi:hypothetical protein
MNKNIYKDTTLIGPMVFKRDLNFFQDNYWNSSNSQHYGQSIIETATKELDQVFPSITICTSLANYTILNVKVGN